jgi:ABC-type antimicrobial peptide transport system permease subunit
VDDRLPLLRLVTLRGHRDSSIYMWFARAGANVFTSLGLAALVLAALGVYGVKSYLVSRRTREIGIRMAIGATSGDVVRLIVREGLLLTAVGLGLGFALSLAVSAVLGSWVYGVQGLDPVVLTVAPAVLLAVALAACYLPARRAASIAPTMALRCE